MKIRYKSLTKKEIDLGSIDSILLKDNSSSIFSTPIKNGVLELGILPGGSFGILYSDEQAQDAIGNILLDSTSIDFTYSDATPNITASAIVQKSITIDASGIKLVNDSLAPGNSYYYGTNGAGTKGYFLTSSASGYTTIGLTFADSPYTVLATSGIVEYLVNCTGGNITINLPTAVTSTAIWGFKKTDSSTNKIVLDANGAQTLDGNLTVDVLFQNSEVQVISDGSNLRLK